MSITSSCVVARQSHWSLDLIETSATEASASASELYCGTYTDVGALVNVDDDGGAPYSAVYTDAVKFASLELEPPPERSPRRL